MAKLLISEEIWKRMSNWAQEPILNHYDVIHEKPVVVE